MKALILGLMLTGCATQPQVPSQSQRTLTGLSLVMGTAAMTMYSIHNFRR